MNYGEREECVSVCFSVALGNSQEQTYVCVFAHLFKVILTYTHIYTNANIPKKSKPTYPPTSKELPAV